MTHESREYQDEVFEAVFDHLFNHEGNGVVAAPGGVGKSHIMNRIIKHLVTKWPGTRVLSLVHDAKVIQQNHGSMLKFWKTAPIGIYSAGLKRKDTLHPIIYAGIQSVAKRISKLGTFNVIFVDECDLLSPKEETLYQKLIAECVKMNPRVRVLGFTATPYRMGTGCLTNLDTWDRIIIDLTETERFNWFVENGFLSPLVTKKSAVEIDVTDIRMKGGEFDEKDMQEAADTEELNRAVVEECIRYGSDRNHWLVFASGVKHGHKLAKLFNSKGIPTIMLSGEDSMDVREKGEIEFRAGAYRCLINVGLYGRGWDFPSLDMLAWARATQSVALWVQGCVRLTRRAEGKDNGLVLDFAGNTRRLGPVNDPVVPAPRRKGDAVKGEAPVKECPECHSYLHTRTMVCPDCGYVFPPPSTIKKTAADDEIMVCKTKDSSPEIKEFRVLGIRYKPTVSKSGKYYLRITYSTGTASFHEAKWFDHVTGGSKRNLEKWWTHRNGLLPIPESVDEAADRAANELTTPVIIRVDLNTKYKEVVGSDFDEITKVFESEDDFSDIPF
jgi:DNA repair protein RadD